MARKFNSKPDYVKGVSGVYTSWVDNDSIKKRFNEISIVGLLLFKTKPSLEGIRKKLAEKAMPNAARLRSVATRDANNKVMFKEIPIEDVDLNYHVSELPSTTPWTDEDIDSYLSEFWCSFHDPSRPLWTMRIIPTLHDGRSALILSADHAVGDGISLVSLLLNLVDDTPSLPDSKSLVPRRQSPGLWARARALVWGLYLVVATPLMPEDPPNQLKLKDIFDPSPECRFAVAERVPLEKVKAIKNRLPGCSVNDVLFAVLHLAVRKYLKDCGDPVADSKGRLRANFPINMRTAKETAAGKFGNFWSTGMLELPMQIGSREEAVWRMKKQVDVIRLSPQPLLEQIMVRQLIALLPTNLLIKVAIQLFSRFTIAMSNVPGPQDPISVGGAELDDLRYWLFSPIGLYAGMISYNGHVSFTVATDPKAIEDPQELTRCWNHEMEALYNEVTTGPARTGPPATLDNSKTEMVTCLAVAAVAAVVWKMFRYSRA